MKLEQLLGTAARSFSSTWACTETPNPDVRKFAASDASLVSASMSGVEGELLKLEGVCDVFVASPEAVKVANIPWVAVTRANGASWDMLAPRVQAVLEGLPEVEFAEEARPAEPPTEASPSAGVEEEIAEVLLHRVRPSVQADGGDVQLISWNAAAGEVVLRLQGACRGCPHSAVTLQETILRTLQHFVPEVRTVVSEEEELDPNSDDPFADLPWTHDGEADPTAVQALYDAGTPFFSTFAGMKMDKRILRRVQFMSRIQLAGRTPEHIFVSCPDCKIKRTIEDPNDLLRQDKGNESGNAAIVICPSCCVLVSR